MATCADKQKMLDEAQQAWHVLQMGGGLVRTRYGDKEVWFNPGNSDRLARYILQLRADVAACTGVADTGAPRRILHVIPTDSR